MSKASQIIILSLVVIASSSLAAAPDQAEFTTAVVDRFKATNFSTFLRTNEVSLSKREDTLEREPGYLAGAYFKVSTRGAGIALFDSSRAALAAVSNTVETLSRTLGPVIAKGGNARDGIADWWYCNMETELSALIVVRDNLAIYFTVEASDAEVEKELWSIATRFLNTAKPSTPANGAAPRR